MAEMSFTYLNSALFISFLAVISLICAAFGGSSRNSVLENASWMDMVVDAGNCKYSNYYGVEGIYSDIYTNVNGAVTKMVKMTPYTELATGTDIYGVSDAASSCLDYADTTMGMVVLALFCSINCFSILLLMRLSESVRRNTFNFKYVACLEGYSSVL